MVVGSLAFGRIKEEIWKWRDLSMAVKVHLDFHLPTGENSSVFENDCLNYNDFV